MDGAGALALAQLDVAVEEEHVAAAIVTGHDPHGVSVRVPAAATAAELPRAGLALHQKHTLARVAKLLHLVVGPVAGGIEVDEGDLVVDLTVGVAVEAEGVQVELSEQGAIGVVGVVGIRDREKAE